MFTVATRSMRRQLPLGFRLIGPKPRLSNLAIQLHAQQSRWQMDLLRWSILLRYASLFRIGEGPQGDPVTPGYARWRQTWDLWTLVFLLRGEKLLGERTGAASWTRPRSGRAHHKKKKYIARYTSTFPATECDYPLADYKIVLLNNRVSE